MVLDLGGAVLSMIWSILGIVLFFVALFFASCWWLDHWLDDGDDDDKRGSWY